MPNISYISKGEGKVILFLHGWGQNKEMMIPLIDELKYKYKCIIIDLPGFGKSAFNGSKNLDEYVSELRKFLKANKIMPKYIVGHSFGGKVAIEYYLKYKDIAKAVIIASPLLKPKRFIEYYYKTIKYKIRKRLHKVTINSGSEDYKNCPLEMKSFFVNVVNTHYNKKIKDIDIPILLLWGDKDKQVPIKKAYILNKIIPSSNLHVLKGEHFAYLENIEFTRLAIQQFLRRI